MVNETNIKEIDIIHYHNPTPESREDTHITDSEGNDFTTSSEEEETSQMNILETTERILVSKTPEYENSLGCLQMEGSSHDDFQDINYYDCYDIFIEKLSEDEENESPERQNPINYSILPDSNKDEDKRQVHRFIYLI